MERRRFLGAVAGVGALLTVASAALAAPGGTSGGSPGGVPSPAPTGSPKHNWRRNDSKSNKNIREVRKHLDKVIDELQHDQHDYAGHRAKALDLLNQARQELLAAEQSVSSTPAPTARPM